MPVAITRKPTRQEIACFARGTRILTAAGERPVEQLSPGDVLPTALGRGDATVRWMGHRRIDCDRLVRPGDAHPVRIAAGAFGDGLPVRDLFLSPLHAVFVQGVLIPAGLLLDGDGIRQMAVGSVDYWHIELERHDVVLAEGLPVESWLDCGNRPMFANTDCVALRFDETRAAHRRWARLACAPLVTRGPRLTAVRRRLSSFITIEVEQDGVHDLPIPASCQGVRLLSPGGVLGGAWLDGEPLDEAAFRAGIVRPEHSDGCRLDEDAFIAIPLARRGRALRLELILEVRREA